MTAEETELVALAERFWQANKEGQLKLAEVTAAKFGIPPVLCALNGASGFLTQLQRGAFMAGVMSALLALEKAEARLANVKDFEDADLAGGKAN